VSESRTSLKLFEVFAALYRDFGGQQALAQSREGDRAGHGRGEFWPQGVVDSLKWFHDFGARTVDATTGAWDPDMGRDRLEQQVGDSACALFTLNGPASLTFTAGARGGPPTVQVYNKAANALLRRWPYKVVVLRLVDEPNVDATTGEPILNPGGMAKVLAWDSTGQDVDW